MMIRVGLPAILAVSFVTALVEHPLWGQTAADKKYDSLRNKLVDEEIVAAGIKDLRVVASMRKTPRHEFVSAEQRRFAYLDMALPIGDKQTISPPFVVAYMTELLEPKDTDKVLEIGTGSGYQAAVLSPLVQDVYTIEIVEPLGRRAAETIKRLKYKNVHAKLGDGYKGWPEHAPFDKIIVTCSPENVPQALIDQLKEGGRLVIPLGERYQQTMWLMRKENGKLIKEAQRATLFVPMTGAAEDARKVKPDPKNPKFVNGSFEETVGDPPTPVGWHYQRQVRIHKDDKSPAMEQSAYFSNTVPGRNSQILQGMLLDGRNVHEIQVSLRIKTDGVLRGRSDEELPSFAMLFYDELRRPITNVHMGPWRGTSEWQEFSQKFTVPKNAREAIVRIGMLGATGQMWADDLTLKVVKRSE